MDHRYNIIAYNNGEWQLCYGCDSLEFVEICVKDLLSRGISKDHILCYDNLCCKTVQI